MKVKIIRTLGGARRPGVLEDEDDVLVKQYAAMALERNYAGLESVMDAVTRTLPNKDEEMDVRVNALSVIEGAGPTPETVGLLNGLMNDRDIGEYVLTTLAKWSRCETRHRTGRA